MPVSVDKLRVEKRVVQTFFLLTGLFRENDLETTLLSLLVTGSSGFPLFTISAHVTFCIFVPDLATPPVPCTVVLFTRSQFNFQHLVLFAAFLEVNHRSPLSSAVGSCEALGMINNLIGSIARAS